MSVWALIGVKKMVTFEFNGCRIIESVHLRLILSTKIKVQTQVVSKMLSIPYTVHILAAFKITYYM